MTTRFSKGDYTAQVFAYERDTIRLLQEVQLYVAAGNALYGAVFLCRYSGQPSSIEKQAIIEASSTPSPQPGRDTSICTLPTAGHDDVLLGDLTLTLLHIDTTWRFDDFNNRLASPNLSWPAICKFYTPGTYVEADLILKDQYPVSGSCFVSRTPAHLLHIEIRCTTDSDALLRDIARKLRTNLVHWTRQLLFQSDPVQHPSAPYFAYVLIMEFDTRHTAETIASSLDMGSLRHATDLHAASCLVRILSLEGSATYHNVTPCVPAELPIDKRTHNEAVNGRPPEPPYFGLAPHNFVHH